MRRFMILAVLGGLSACRMEGTPGTGADVDGASFTAVIAPVVIEGPSRGRGATATPPGPGAGAAPARPAGADPEACYGREVAPAVIETVTEQTLIGPEGGASPRGPAVAVSESFQRIVEDRREIWFETPCGIEQDPAFMASLQRALAARGLHSGPVTGEMDAATVAAIRAYQAPQGLDSGILSLAAARQLGLALWDPELAARRPAAPGN